MDVSEHLRRLRVYVEKQNFEGYDPYDALNSPILRLLTCDRKWARVAAIQALRRLPFNLRPALLADRGQNPKALGLFLEGYSQLYRCQPSENILSTIDRLVKRLDALRSPGCSGNGWGYNFDWQSRAFFLPRFTPTIVNSAFIGHALVDAYETTGSLKALDLALPIATFILADLNRIPCGDLFCFSYTPLDHYPVHNANLLGASLLIRLHHLTGNTAEKTSALSALAYTTRCQHEDGSWFYSETPGSRWVDSFHTGFVLESLRHFVSLGDPFDCRQAYERGMRYYAERCFLQDGTPKYYTTRTFPADIHSAAEAISVFATEGVEYRPLALRVLGWMLTKMCAPEGYFYYQRTRFFTNKISYMRWSQAWAFRSLSRWLAANSKSAPAALNQPGAVVQDSAVAATSLREIR